MGEVGPVLVGAIIYLSKLPYLVLAWTEPDPILDEA